MSERVFVYGTLRKGGSNDFRMAECRFLGPGMVRGQIYRIDWYPGLVPGDVGDVAGEIYEVESGAMRALDEFEGLPEGKMEGGGYRRVKAMVYPESGEPLEAWIWQWIGGIEGCTRLESGDWLNPG